jgi:hypothetical protein
MSMPIEAKRGVVVSMGCFSGCCGIVFEDYPRGGSSRSIPLADLAGAKVFSDGGRSCGRYKAEEFRDLLRQRRIAFHLLSS